MSGYFAVVFFGLPQLHFRGDLSRKIDWDPTMTLMLSTLSVNSCVKRVFIGWVFSHCVCLTFSMLFYGQPPQKCRLRFTVTLMLHVLSDFTQ